MDAQKGQDGAVRQRFAAAGSPACCSGSSAELHLTSRCCGSSGPYLCTFGAGQAALPAVAAALFALTRPETINYEQIQLRN